MHKYHKTVVFIHISHGGYMKIAVYNNKGGVGKTSLVAHVGFRAIEKRQVITVLDADRQHNTMDWLTSGQWDGNATVLMGTVTVTRDISEADANIVIIDCPPAFEVVSLYNDVDIWIVPVNGRFSVSGAMGVIDEIKKIDRNPRIVLVPNMVDIRSDLGSAEMREIQKIDVELFKCNIPRHDVVSKAEMATKAAWDIPYGMRSLAAQNLKVFSDWVLQGCNTNGVYNG